MTKQSESSIANNGGGCQETGPAQDFVVRYEIVPPGVMMTEKYQKINLKCKEVEVRQLL